MSNRLTDLDLAAALDADGASIGIGGVLLSRKPVGMLAAIADRGASGLRAYSFLASIDVELLAARGCLAEVHTGYVGLERLGQPPAYAAAVEAGAISVREYSELLFTAGVRAATAGLPFFPTRGAVGSDVLASIQFVSPAQIDRAGKSNVSRVPDGDGRRRLPGPLAFPDVARLVGRLIAYRADHSRRFLLDRVPFVTGHGARVAAVVTDKAVLLRIEDGAMRIPVGGLWSRPKACADHRARACDRTYAGGMHEPGGMHTPRAPQARRVQITGLHSVHAGATADEVVGGCGFFVVAGDVAQSEPPPPEALELLDAEIDPRGARHLETRSGRAAALERLAGAAR